MDKPETDFAVFILTHGRPDKVHTFKTLNRHGYTGKVYIVIDDADAKRQDYVDKFGDKVIMFSKSEIAETFDSGDNFKERRTIIYARNACFEIAKKMGIKWFVQLDDDYSRFQFKFDEEYNYKETPIKNLDKAFGLMLVYYQSINAHAIALAQNGDFIGGADAYYVEYGPKLLRKCMNTFFLSTERPFRFIGKVNEDINTYTRMGSTGALFLTVLNLAITQKPTQSSSGGMTETYLDNGTYVKSFYTVMYMPSAAKIALMGPSSKRLHTNISWKHAVPKILHEKYRKQA